ncbi:unnamed protein product [Adineta steineri]|uniref:Uncharacterized protein n=1 Tax=Adineta steineri TaxID=433720 RepID=A0A814DAV7_9BILA|nr:unnamed protein product [Adineta steineri]CAF1510606.1 unnamed protein product [Adineta steineri]
MISILLLLILLTINDTNSYQCSKNLTSSTCRQNHAGIYYIYLNSSDHSYYELISLNSEGSFIILGSDQQSAAASTTKSAVVQPYSDILGKWTCEVHDHLTKILINGYNFVYKTKVLKNYAVIEKYTLTLDHNSMKIQGQQKFTFVTLNATQSFKERKSQKEPFLFDINGYQVEKYCVSESN